MVKCCVCLSATLIMLLKIQAQIKYPATLKVHQEDIYHGTKIEDPYRWLEDDTSAATANWVREENKITSVYLDGIPWRHKVRKRMSEFYNYPRYTAPFRNNKYYYYYKNDGLQNFSVLYRNEITDSVAETVLDPNKLSMDGSVQLTDFVPSRDGKYAAWGTSNAGSDWQTFFVRDLSTMTDLQDTVRWVKVSDIAWQKNGFYYSRYPAPEPGKELSSRNENQQVWYHTVGTNQSADKLIYEDPANPYRFYTTYTSHDERYLFLTITDRGKGLMGNALWYRDSESKDKQFQPIISEIGDYIYGFVDPDEDGKFLIQTNENAPNGKVMLFDPTLPLNKQWRTIIPERQETLKSASMAGGQIFLQYLKDVTSRVYVTTAEGLPVREISLPGLGTTAGFEGLREDSVVFYTYTSLNYPVSIFKYSLATGKTTLIRKPEIMFNPDDYVVTQKFYSSKDGTKVPMFIVNKKGIKRDGKNPTLMYGYGGFNIVMSPNFNTSLMPWLEQGGIYVLVNLRGGGEYGEKWHQAGMFGKKQNVFDDFIYAAQYLISRKYTNPSRLAIRGGSNGGLLIGAVINQRPELFKVAIPDVGVMDMLRYQKFTIGWNWKAEYGSSENKKDFDYLVKYSPLHNIKSGAEYPATLILTADHDDRVVPAHSFKYAATLQEKYTGKNPILLKVDENSGHGLSGIVKNIEIASDIYSFILFNMNVQWKDVSGKSE